MKSVFEDIPESRWIASNPVAFAIWDGYPVTLGHALVITRRAAATWFEATEAEQRGVMALVDRVRRQIEALYHPDGFNVGFNAGRAAGQTVDHLHVHVIPRYLGDMDDPRGGVRHVVPSRGNYKRVAADWEDPPGPSNPVLRKDPLTTGQEDRRLGPCVEGLFRQAGEVAMVSAFVRESGVKLILGGIEDVLQRGGQVRLLTGDYLGLTSPDALQRLFNLQGRARAFESFDEIEPSRHLTGSFEVRVIETARALSGRSFHPKAWIFRWGGEPFEREPCESEPCESEPCEGKPHEGKPHEGEPHEGKPHDGVAYVGSSNISRSALTTGVEWNLRVERRLDPVAYDRLSEAFEELWPVGATLTAPWIEAYRARIEAGPPQVPPGSVDLDEVVEILAPTPVQAETLAALSATRAEGRRRALIVLATGLGKTFLAAFDVEAFEAEIGRRARVLFIAHRRELLAQAGETFFRVFPARKVSWCVGSVSDLGGELVFASVQKLSRRSVLRDLHPEAFDYVIVDEVHHAAAASYRRILSILEPLFLLGLTATPDRTDEADILGLFDDHLPCRVDLGEGIARGLLVPFDYQGLEDTTDYKPIPWRNRSFSPEELALAVQTQARMESLWEAWQAHPGTRTLVFCASIEHARFVEAWLEQRGVKIKAVHSGTGSFERSEGLSMLSRGDLDALCTVDLFNEGIDVREIDRVVMLRPTESAVVFLQQLGRGLRTHKDKNRLQVIDFVGNHRVFLDRVRTLLSLTGKPASLRGFLNREEAADLPPGCSVQIALGAINLLEKLLPSGSPNELVRTYRELSASRGQRPSAGELYRRDLNPASVRQGSSQGWFDFVRQEGDLSDVQERAHRTGAAWLRELETTSMSKCFKMVVLEVILDADALFEGLDLDVLSRRSHALLMRDPGLFRDLEGVKALGDPRAAGPEQWRRYWMNNPVAAWTKPSKQSGGAWFSLEGERLRSRVPRPQEDEEAEEALVEMTRELVDWRLAAYRWRLHAPSEGDASAFEMKVLTNGRHPILHFGTIKGRSDLPNGETDVRMEDGALWSFRFAAVECNVARPVAGRDNRLPDLLYGWFGPDAGRSGTDFRVRFERAPEGWWVEPLGARVLPWVSTRGAVVAFTDLRAAAGADMEPQRGAVGGEVVRLPLTEGVEGAFAVRASGHSMDGGDEPIRDGDWVLMRWARGQRLGAVEGRVVLVTMGSPEQGPSHHLKRLIKTPTGFELHSDNPTFAPIAARPDAAVIARRLDVIRPEALAPAPGLTFDADGLQEAFGLSSPPTAPLSRVDGHLFVFLPGAGRLAAPDRARLEVPDRRPGETAFVLGEIQAGSWRTLGVARLEQDGLWALPEVDFETWRALGQGRSASRRLEDVWLSQARDRIAELVARSDRTTSSRGKTCRVLGLSAQGGVRIDGGPGGFGPRTVSRVDLAWVLKGRHEATIRGGIPDEALVNRLRYLNGTPRESTRWIDTGWALVLTDRDA